MFKSSDRSKLLHYLSKKPPVVAQASSKSGHVTTSYHASATAKSSGALMLPTQQLTTKSADSPQSKKKNGHVITDQIGTKKRSLVKPKKSGQVGDKRPAMATVSAKAKRKRTMEKSLAADVASMIADYRDKGVVEGEDEAEATEDGDLDVQEDLEDEVYEEADDSDESLQTVPEPPKKARKQHQEVEEPEEITRRSAELGSRARQALATSMFRSLNEFLYCHDSTETRKSFTPAKFQMYHQAYEKLMAEWPLKPVDYLIDVLMKRIKPAKLPSTVIADVGCGSKPRIAEAFSKATVYSYDLHQADQTDARIISADMSRLPLDSNQCDYAVYSLSLMPTNLKDCLREANRILKIGGHMLVVEVASRFADYKSSRTGRVLPEEKHTAGHFAGDLKSYGFRLTETEDLPPNGFFVYLCFKKTAHVETLAPKSKLPPITLKACLYKAR